MRSAVIGDFHDPYGEIFGVFTNLVSLSFSVFELNPRESFEKLLSQPRKGFTRFMQPKLRGSRLVSAPSLILHGRTEIKARALVLGEVSALSFCPITHLPY